jgi:molybdopterin-guanine dinucleotide biosynthesis protein
MAIIVVGGHTRNIGKTSVVCGLIAAMPERNWTAFKVTQFGHGVCSANGQPCDCETADHTLAISEEHRSDTGTDSSRYLQAGAKRSLWVRTRMGELAEAMPRIRMEIERSENVIVESNSILRFLQPDLSVSVLDPTIADFKKSALRYLDRVDAVLVAKGDLQADRWKDVAPSIIERIQQFRISPPAYCPGEFVSFLRKRLEWIG